MYKLSMSMNLLNKGQKLPVKNLNEVSLKNRLIYKLKKTNIILKYEEVK